ncbi:MAG TPA: ABC transporter substrate-binding protein [Ilumatobacter sp.]|nr:ABC transporter substrate-binding protein [Ilumatobacter sp.]
MGALRAARLAVVAGAFAVAGIAPAVAGAQDNATVTLTIGLTQDLASPNVTVGYLVSDFEVWNLQYAALTNKAADDFETIPGLAESWDVSDDGLTVTYHLREGLLWSDGEPLTADDVVYTIERSRDEEWFNHYATVQNLTAEAPDTTTVVLTSSVPDPKLPTMDVYILPKHIYEQYDADAIGDYDAMDGVASGAYSLKEWNAGQGWTMVRNPNYFGPDNGIDQIVFRLFTNVSAEVAALETGEIDAAHNLDASAFEQLTGKDHIVTVAGLQGGFTELGWNGGASGLGDGHPALLDPAVRQAIFHAVDRNVILNRVSAGLGAVGTTISVSADPSWIPDLGDENWAYDPDLSRQLLDDAGFVDADGDGVRDMPDGSRSLTFRIVQKADSAADAAIVEFVSGWLEQIGIATDVSTMDEDTLFEAQASAEYDLFTWGWTPYVDPDIMLSYFTCAQVTTDPDEPGWNDANWCNEEYDALYEQQKVELDEDARREIVAEMLKLFNREAPYLVLTMDPDLQAYRTDRFTGWTQQPAGTGPVLFNNSSPTYDNLRAVGAEPPANTDGPEATTPDGGTAPAAPAPTTPADDDDGFPVVPVVIGVAAVVVLGGLIVALKRRGSSDERE